MTKNKKVVSFMFLLSFLGFCFFYLVPFAVSFVYSLIDNPIHREFRGFLNYQELFSNLYFIRGLKNTVLFMIISIPCTMVLSLWAALRIDSIKKYTSCFSLIFLIPLAVPSATSAFFWQHFFAENGAFNKFLSLFGIPAADWLNEKYGLVAMAVIFIWKNTGYDMVLFLSGLSGIPKLYYEVAEMEGAGRFWKFWHITFLYLTPVTFLVLIMTFVNTFKIFKEIYLLTGEYPSENLYVLQHFMNNLFLELDYSRLASAVYILTALVVPIVLVIFCWEKRLSAKLQEF